MVAVFLHALPFAGTMWSEFDRGVADRSIAPDLFELGACVEEWAEAVVALAGGEEMVVIGCSVGGSCALEIARLVPDQVSGIVLIGAKAGVRPEPEFRDRAIRLLETQGMEAAWRKYWAPLFGRSTPPDVVESARRRALGQDVGDVVNGVRAFHDRRDLTDLVDGWTKQLVVVSGDQDTTPPASAIRALGNGPRREFHIVANSGHYVNLEQPRRLRSILTDAMTGLDAQR